MKKTLLLISFHLMIYSAAISQTATSIANGNWTNPFTWSCTCVPTPGYTVIINTNVTLNTSFPYSTGSITINNGESLIEDMAARDIWVNGGSLTNNGTLDVRYLWMQTGTFVNTGTITMRSFLNNVNFTNDGIFQNVDSIYNTANIISNGNFLNIDSITNDGSFINNGISIYNQFTNNGQFNNNNKLSFTDITNNGTLINSDTIIAQHSGWNRGTWNNLASGYFLVNNSFLNGDSTSAVALFILEGKMIVNNSWYNIDTVRGISGSIVVTDTSINWGRMNGTFDFCDKTPPSTAPYVDYNFGVIENGITWCANAGISEALPTQFNLFPNPASDEIKINAGELKNYEVRIFSSHGTLLGIYKNPTSIDVSEKSDGLYLVSIKSEKTYLTKRIQIIKH